jgi:hypothetical protein
MNYTTLKCIDLLGTDYWEPLRKRLVAQYIITSSSLTGTTVTEYI